MSSGRILIVEDDTQMSAALCDGFEQDRYSVTIASNGRQGYELARTRFFDAIVLDLMLPLLDGFIVASQLRAEGIRIPILMLTARDSVDDVVKGFDSGAEDYLTKPFKFLELAARIRSLIRRGKPQSAQLQVGDLVMDRASHRVDRGGRTIALTKTELLLLEALLGNSGHVVSRNELSRAAWEPYTRSPSEKSSSPSSLPWLLKQNRPIMFYGQKLPSLLSG